MSRHKSFLSQGPAAPSRIVIPGISAEETVEYEGWTLREKFLFLLGYQWLSAVTAPRMKIFLSNEEYQGLLPVTVTWLSDAVRAMDPVLSLMAPESLSGVTEMASGAESLTKEAGRTDQITQRYRGLRDQVVKDLLEPVGDPPVEPTLQYENFGDQPQNPGVLVRTRIMREGQEPDLSAIFSTMRPAELLQAGMGLQEKYAEIGVPFTKVQAPFQLGAAPAGGILVLIIAAVVIILGILFLVLDHNRKSAPIEHAIDAIESDTSMTPAQKAEALSKLNGAKSFLEGFVGAEFPWSTLILATAGAVALVYVGPSIVGALSGKGS